MICIMINHLSIINSLYHQVGVTNYQTGSIAKSRTSEQGASKASINESISKSKSQEMKRKAVEIDSTNNESKEDDGFDYSKSNENDNDDSEDDNKVFFLGLCIKR